MPLIAMQEHSVSCRLSRELTAPRNAREHAREALFGWGLGEHADLVEIIISELVTNAIRHGAGPVGTRLSHGRGQLCVEVHDDGRDRPVRRQAGAEDESGRGLAMIDGLIESYGGSLGVTDDDAGYGKTVHVSICLTGGEIAVAQATATIVAVAGMPPAPGSL
jgi:anti-sigma regulatory factor (Ser/Thr protein kinase)